jgi:hypothetical protein
VFWLHLQKCLENPLLAFKSSLRFSVSLSRPLAEEIMLSFISGHKNYSFCHIIAAERFFMKFDMDAMQFQGAPNLNSCLQLAM